MDTLLWHENRDIIKKKKEKKRPNVPMGESYFLVPFESI